MFTPKRLRTAGLLLILLGAWVATLPLWGPEAGFAIAGLEEGAMGQQYWTMYLVPGAAAALGGLLMLLPRFAALAKAGGILAVLGGAWLVIGPVLSDLWLAQPIDLSAATTAEALEYHLVPGVLIAALGGYAVALATWARQWRLYHDDTIEGARTAATRETIRHEVEKEQEERGRTDTGEMRGATAGERTRHPEPERAESGEEPAPSRQSGASRTRDVVISRDDGDGDGEVRRGATREEHHAVDHRSRESSTT